MRILLTGAGGFIGGHIARHLEDNGHNFACTARGYLPPGHFDTIIHAGAAAGPWHKASTILRDNVVWMENLLYRLADHRKKKFIFLSSVSIYGDFTGEPISETSPRINPSLYGMSKWWGEEMLRAMAAHYDSISLRLPGVIGPGARTTNWLPRVAQQIKERDTVPIFNPTDLFNNAVHISDLCEFISVLLTRDFEGSEALVLGASAPLTIEVVVQRLAHQLGHSLACNLIPTVKPPTLIDSSLAQSAWDYRPMEMGEMIDRFAKEIL